MNIKLFVTCLLLSFVYLYANNRKNDLIYNDSLFEIWSDSLFNISADFINKHVNIIKRVINLNENERCDSINLKKTKERFRFSIKGKEATYYGNKTEVKIDTQNCLLVSYFKLSSLQKITSEEQDFFKLNKKISPNLVKISENEAITVSKEFLNIIYYEHYEKILNEFDMIKVGYGPDCYIVKFLCSTKNDIKDNREIEFHILSSSGEIRWFYSNEIFSPYDLSYKPKVTKKKVFEMIEKHFIQLGINVQYDLYLTQNGRSKNKWAWHLYGVKENSNQKIKDCIIIDSETGEILMNTFGPNK